MRRTKVCHVYSSDELIRALRQLRIVCKNQENDESFQNRKPLVIIDSLPAVIFKVPIDKFLLMIYITSRIFYFTSIFIFISC